MNNETRKQAREIVRVLQKRGVEFEVAAIFIADFLKRRGVSLSDKHLTECFS